MKICTKCNRKLPIEKFRWYPKKQYRNAQCKTCENKHKNEWKKRNRKRPSVRRAERKRHLRRYNLSLEDYDKMFEQQKDVCAICNQPEIKRLLGVDHSHKTGKVRGLLCTHCNYKLGVIENKDFVIKANKYLKEAGKIK